MFTAVAFSNALGPVLPAESVTELAARRKVRLPAAQSETDTVKVVPEL